MGEWINMKIKYIEFEQELHDTTTLSPGKRLDLIDDINDMLAKQEENAMNYDELNAECKRLEDKLEEYESAQEFLTKMQDKYDWDSTAIEDFLDCIHAHGIPDSIDLDCKLGKD
jgi:uncharacterized membrane protein YukC